MIAVLGDIVFVYWRVCVCVWWWFIIFRAMRCEPAPLSSLIDLRESKATIGKCDWRLAAMELCVCVLWVQIIFWTFIGLINWETLYDKELETNCKWRRDSNKENVIYVKLNFTSIVRVRVRVCVCVCYIMSFHMSYRLYSGVVFLSIQVMMWTLYYYFGMIIIHTHEPLFLNDNNKSMKLRNPNHTWTVYVHYYYKTPLSNTMIVKHGST